jgi:hypothetical protein
MPMPQKVGDGRHKKRAPEVDTYGAKREMCLARAASTTQASVPIAAILCEKSAVPLQLNFRTVEDLKRP